MRAVCLIALAALSACDTQKPPPCPGSKVAALRFVGLPDAPTDGTPRCAFTRQTPAARLDFTATLAWEPAGVNATLCIDRLQAAQIPGGHIGDKVSLTLTTDNTSVADCNCAISVKQIIEGEVTRYVPDGGADDGGIAGEAIGFKGELLNYLYPTLIDGGTPGDPSDGGSDGGAEGTACGCTPMPCQVRYLLSATK